MEREKYLGPKTREGNRSLEEILREVNTGSGNEKRKEGESEKKRCGKTSECKDEKRREGDKEDKGTRWKRIARKKRREMRKVRRRKRMDGGNVQKTNREGQR